MEIKKMIPYIVTSKRKKYLGINLVKEIKGQKPAWAKQTLSKRNKK